MALIVAIIELGRKSAQTHLKFRIFSSIVQSPGRMKLKQRGGTLCESTLDRSFISDAEFNTVVQKK